MNQSREKIWFKTRYMMKAPLNLGDKPTGISYSIIEEHHVDTLADMMLSAYRGGVDSESESFEEAQTEIRDTLQGKYGQLLSKSSLIATVDGRAASAVLFVRYEEEKMPLMAYAMTHADFKGRGIATALIKAALNALVAEGYSECCLVVSEGNEPARTIYKKLGFKDMSNVRFANADFLKDQALQDAYGRLVLEFNCHTVVLYGSRARGDASDDSDYDLVGFAKDGEEINDSRVSEGKFIDAYVYPERRAVEETVEFLRLRGGIVLREENGFGSKLMERVEAHFNAGPKALRPDEVKQRLVWIEKMLVRIKRDDIESRYRRTWLLADLLEIYFVLRGQWYLGPKESIRWLQNNDSKTFSLFDQALQPGASLVTIRELSQNVMDRGSA